VREAERLGAAEALLGRPGRATVRLDRAGEAATELEAAVPYPPTLTWAEPVGDEGGTGGDGL
jgi:hypothetical protein